MPRFQIYACFLAVILVAWSVVTNIVPTLSGGMRIAEDFKEIPLTINDWYSEGNLPVDKLSLSMLSTCSILNRDYIKSDGNRSNLSIVYGREIGDFHQPEFCMQGSGFHSIKSSLVTMRPKGMKPFLATAVTMTNDVQDIVMIYWFYMGGNLAPKMGMEKFKAIWLALRGGVLPPSAMVKFTTPIIVDDEMAIKNSVQLCELLAPSIIKMAKKPPKFEPMQDVLK